jgi:hypothetical protein
MVIHDLGRWPLAISTMSGTVTNGEYLDFLSAWGTWLDRDARFASLRRFTDAASLVHPQGSAKEAKAWLQANGMRIRLQVVALVTVVPSECLEAASRMDAAKLFGVPALTCSDLDQGLDWGAARLEQSGLSART